MRRGLLVTLLVIVLAAALLSLNSSPRRPPRLPAGKPAVGTTTGNEQPTPPGPLQSAPGAPSPAAAVLSFATRYINWRGEQVAATLRALAAASVGQARSAMLLAAAQTKADPALSTNGIVNRGSVQALAPLRGQADKYAVVTLETTSGSAAYAGLPASWHVTIATVTERPGGWVVSGWQPQT